MTTKGGLILLKKDIVSKVLKEGTVVNTKLKTVTFGFKISFTERKSI